MKEKSLHAKNKFNKGYNFDELTKVNPLLKEFVSENKFGTTTIDFANPKAVKELNKGLLFSFDKITVWDFPDENLCPPIPGRLDYIHHLADLLSSEENIKILDIGTGSGCIPITLAKLFPAAEIVAVDVSEGALKVANSNNDKLETKVTFTTLDVLTESNWEKLRDFDIIVSNPPYIDGNDPHLSQGDVRFEPQTALVAEQEGFADLLHIIDHSRQHLIDSGWLLMEHGFEQGNQLRDYFIEYGFINVKTEKDYAGNDRVTLGQWTVNTENKG